MKKTKNLLICLFLSNGILTAQKKPDQKVLEKNLSQLVNINGLANPVYRWNAYLILPQGTAVEVDAVNSDYASVTHNDAWDFNEVDTEGITKFSEGIIDPEVEDGNLTFKTAKNAYFYWGDHFNDPGVNGLQIGADWSVAPYFVRQFWFVKMRIKQSLPESKWRITAKVAGVPTQINKKELVIKGTEWQEVTFPFRVNTGSKQSARRHSLCIESETENNQVKIDSVKVIYFLSWSYDKNTWQTAHWEKGAGQNSPGKECNDTIYFPEFAEDTVYVGFQTPISYEKMEILLKKYAEN